MSLHPIIARAAEGTLPDWVCAGDARRAHMERVASLLSEWAEAWALEVEDRARWCAAGYLHDAVRDADPEELRPRMPPAMRAFPGHLLHGPVAAERLRVEGVEDGELLNAVAYHTVGDAGFGELGHALYAADFLEPGRTFRPEWRAELRTRVPDDLDGVVRDIARARIGHLIERGLPVLPRTIAFWNRLAGDAS